MITFKKTYLAVFCAIALSSCSGGGGGSSSSSKTTTPTPTETKTPETTKTEDTTPEVNNIKNNFTSDGKVKVGIVDSGAVASEGVLSGTVASITKYSLTSTGQTSESVSLSSDISTQDVADNAHGSFVSSVIAGNTDNGSTAGIAEGSVSLYEAQVTDSSGNSKTLNNLLAMRDLQKNQNVNLFNNSWGSHYGNTLDSSSLSTLKELVENGALIIFSTGNDSSTTPSDQSLSPVTDSSLTSGIIAVTGINSNGKANSCGNSAAWCVAGDYTSKNYYIQKLGGLYYYTGTSGAAPQITAEAALVWKNFQWMTNENVKYTILTTATAMDDGSGVSTPYNATYGWGYYNIDKALNGPSMFYSTLGDFSADVFSGYSSTFSNDISGNAGLTKNGLGELDLTGNNTYTGNTVVNEGTLKITGTNENSDFIVNSSGLLLGNGSTKSLTNNGTVSTEIGTLKVNGNYVQGSDGVLNYYLGNNINATGDVSLSGTLNVYSKDKLFTNGNYDIISGNSLSGQFNTVNSGSSFLKVNSVSYNNNVAQANVSLVDATTTGTNSSTSTKVGGSLVNQVLNKASSSENSALISYAEGIEASSNSSTAQNIMDSHTGIIYSELPSVLVSNQSVNTSILSNHLYEIDKDNNQGVWVNQSALTTKNKANGWNTVSSSNYNSTVGVDFNANSDLLLGFSATKSYLDSKADNSGGQAKTNLTSVGIYSKYQHDNTGLYIDNSFSYGFGNTEIDRRSISGDGSSNYLNNDANIKTSNAYIEAGYDYNNGNIKVSPFVGLEYNYAHIDSVNEKGSNGLKVSENSQDQVSTTEGIRAAYSLNKNLSFNGFVARKDVLNRSKDNTNISMNIDNSINESYTSPTFENVSYLYGAGIAYQPEESWLLNTDIIGYNGKSNSYALSIGLKYMF